MPHVQSDSEAGYVDGTFDIRKYLRATAGVRYTREHKERTGLGAVYLPNTGGQPFRFGTEGFRFADTDRTIYDPNDPNVFKDGIKTYGARDTLPQLLVSPGTNFTAQNGTYTDHFVDWRLGADMDLTPRNMVYVTATTGHHSGGFNDNIGDVAKTYKPERLYALEIGSKNQTVDRKLTVNGAVFGYLYYDQQFTGVQSLIDPDDPMAVAGRHAGPFQRRQVARAGAGGRRQLQAAVWFGRRAAGDAAGCEVRRQARSPTAG